MLPAGRFSVNLGASLWPGETAGQSTITRIAVTNRTAEGGCPRMFSLRDMDLHLVDDVVKITARIPDGSFRLNASLGVGGAREDRIISGLRSKLVMPQPPRIARLVLAQRCGFPGRSAIG